MPNTTVSEDKRQELSSSISKSLEQFREDVSSNDGWTEFYSDDDMKAFEINVPNYSVKKVKGVAVVNTELSAQEFLTILDEEKMKSDDAIIGDEVVAVLEPKPENAPSYVRDTWDIRHLKYNTPGGFLVSNRDFVSQTKTFTEGENILRVTSAVQGDEFPEESGFLRAQMILSGWYVEKASEKQLKIVFVNHSDPSGWIPAMVVNSKLLDAA